MKKTLSIALLPIVIIGFICGAIFFAFMGGVVKAAEFLDKLCKVVK